MISSDDERLVCARRRYAIATTIRRTQVASLSRSIQSLVGALQFVLLLLDDRCRVGQVRPLALLVCARCDCDCVRLRLCCVSKCVARGVHRNVAKKAHTHTRTESEEKMCQLTRFHLSSDSCCALNLDSQRARAHAHTQTHEHNVRSPTRGDAPAPRPRGRGRNTRARAAQMNSSCVRVRATRLARALCQCFNAFVWS